MVQWVKNEKIISTTINTKKLPKDLFLEKKYLYSRSIIAFQSRQCANLRIKMFSSFSWILLLKNYQQENKIMEKFWWNIYSVNAAFLASKKPIKILEQQFSVLENVSQKI